MKTYTRPLALTGAALLLVSAAGAAEPTLRLANILTDNMVLQRDKPVRIWGWAAPGADVKVTITEDAALAAPLVAKAPKDPPPELDPKKVLPPPPPGAYRATVAYAEHNAAPFATVRRTTRAAADGAWEVQFPAMGASFQPKFILAESAGRVDSASNVLVGVVWLNTGQSNIQRLGFDGSDLELPSASMPGIRFCKIDGSWYKPLDDLPEPAGWLVCSPRTAGMIPGVSYFFARTLHRYLNVPVGIINNARGGTTGQAWCSREELNKIDHPSLKTTLPKYDAECARWESEAYRRGVRAEQVAAARALVARYEKDLAAYNALPADKKARARPPKPPKLKATKALRETKVLGDPREGWSPPAGLFNAVVYPLRKLHIEGMLYYQGENNNFGLWSRYELTFPRVLASHRAVFGDPKMPIGVVGLPGWKQFGEAPEITTVADGYALIRDIHDRTCRAVDGADLIACYDLGGPGIHPGDKRPVGERSGRWALARVYGKPVYHRGPIYREMKIAPGKDGRKIVKLYFDVDPLARKEIDKHNATQSKPPPAWMTLPVPAKSMPAYTGFIIAGKDRRWYPAEVVRNDEPALEVSSPFVPEPVAVRYAWANRPDANAVGRGRLPVLSFRTDDWPLPESWKYDPALARPVEDKLRDLRAAGRRQALERLIVERMRELSALDAERYLGKGERSTKALLLAKADRIAAVVADIQAVEAELFRKRGGNPEIDKKLQQLQAVLEEVRAEIGKLER